MSKEQWGNGYHRGFGHGVMVGEQSEVECRCELSKPAVKINTLLWAMDNLLRNADEDELRARLWDITRSISELIEPILWMDTPYHISMRRIQEEREKEYGEKMRAERERAESRPQEEGAGDK